jgi:CBS domain-containing protein
MLVRDIMNAHVVTAAPDDRLLDIAVIMREKHVGNVVVVEDPAERRQVPIGVITDRDLVVGALAQAPDAMATLKISDLMTDGLVTATEDDTLGDVLEQMRGFGVRRVPVVDAEGMLVGIVTMSDALTALANGISELAEIVRKAAAYEKHVRA